VPMAEKPNRARPRAITSSSRGRLRSFSAAIRLLTLLAAFVVSFAAPAAAQEAIQSYRSEITVAQSGTLHVAETIQVFAEGDKIRRGIYRDFPLTFQDADGTVHEVGFRLLSVTRDGNPEPHFTQTQGEFIRIYAGEESVFLQPGRSYTYVFTYETDRQIRWFPDHAELYWNVTGNGWDFPIEATQVRVTLPGNAPPVRWTAYSGRYGERGTDWRGAVTDGVLAVETTRTLASGEGLTIVEEIPPGVVDQPSGTDKARYFLRDNRGSIIGGVGFLLVLGYYVTAWNAVGRDPKGGTIIPLFHAPDGVSPALAGYIRNWGFGMDARREFTAAALALAVKGLVVFDEEKKKELTLERTKTEWPGGYNALPPGEREILRWVDKHDGKGRIAQDKATAVAEVTTKFRKGIESENKDKFFKRNTLYFVGGLALTILIFVAVLVFGGLHGTEIGLLFPVFFTGGIFGIIVVPILRTILAQRSFFAVARTGMSLAVALGFFVYVAGQFLIGVAGNPYGALNTVTHFVTTHPLAIAFLLIFPALNGIFLYLLRAPTTLGRPVMDQLAGFRMYLETAESGRLNIAGAPDMTTERFESLLPYAVALDVEKPWADAFAAALKRAHPDDPDPVATYYNPGWRRGGSWSSDSFGRSMNSAVSAATGALAASVPRSSSGSSGFSGGGGSGGGGGGGGGGGW
jgi:uncharacterized membrane protein YgcG